MRIVSIRSTAGFFVDARSDKDHACAGELVIITVLDVDLRRKRRAVTDIGRDSLRRLSGAIDLVLEAS